MRAANSNVAAPFMQVLNGFADARDRLMQEWTEREIHPFDERPVGSGWVRIGSDAGYGIWERRRVTEVPL